MAFNVPVTYEDHELTVLSMKHNIQYREIYVSSRVVRSSRVYFAFKVYKYKCNTSIQSSVDLSVRTYQILVQIADRGCGKLSDVFEQSLLSCRIILIASP